MHNEIIQLIEGRDSKTFTRLVNSRPPIKEFVDELTQKWSAENVNEVIYCVVNSIEPPLCPCGSKALFNSYSKGYRKFCNYRCPKKGEAHSSTMTQIWEDDPDRKAQVTEAVRRTMMERYGADNAMHVPDIVDRVKQTNLDRYGVELPFQSAEIRERASDSLMQSHGVKTPFESAQIRAQAAATFVENHGAPNRMQFARAAYHEKHGVENTFQVPVVKEKIRDTLLERYGVEHPLQSPEIMAKQQATVQARYGVTNVAQSAEVRERGRRTCQALWGRDNGAQQHYSDDTWAFMQDDSRFIEEMKVETVAKLADQYSLATSTIYKRASKLGIKPLNPSGTSNFEGEVVEFIRAHYSGTVHHHDRTVISPQEIDIYLPDRNFAVECNGTWWHSELGGKASGYHQQKTDRARQAGVTLFHIWEHDWSSRRPIIQSMLLARLGQSRSIAARGCVIQPLSSATARQFYEENHIQGWAPSTVHLGLHHDGKLVMAVSLAKPRYSRQYQWELIRMASLCEHTVTGGASRLLTQFRREHSPQSIVSYSDRSYATGRVYGQLGFAFSHTSAPNYWYTHDHQQFYHRSRFQKHRLPAILPVYDPQLTEWQNMQANGWNRIWDCGNDVWVLKCK